MEAAARTARQNGEEPGERPMTRHGMIQPSAAGTQPPATDPRVSMVIAGVDRRVAGPAPGRQYRAMEQRSGLSASTSRLPFGGRANADIGRRSKFP